LPLVEFKVPFEFAFARVSTNQLSGWFLDWMNAHNQCGFSFAADSGLDCQKEIEDGYFRQLWKQPAFDDTPELLHLKKKKMENGKLQKTLWKRIIALGCLGTDWPLWLKLVAQLSFDLLDSLPAQVVHACQQRDPSLLVKDRLRDYFVWRRAAIQRHLCRRNETR
jgi:hypothetical protein